VSLPWQKEVAKGSYDHILSNEHLVHVLKGSYDHILSNEHLVHVLKFRLRHLPCHLSAVDTQFPQIIHIHRICQLNPCRAASVSPRRVTCPIHCILLDLITLSDEKHKLCRSPFHIYILHAFNCVLVLWERQPVSKTRNLQKIWTS